MRIEDLLLCTTYNSLMSREHDSHDETNIQHGLPSHFSDGAIFIACRSIFAGFSQQMSDNSIQNSVQRIPHNSF